MARLAEKAETAVKMNRDSAATAARRIGELLVSEGVLSEAALNRAVVFQRLSRESVRLGSILLNWDLLREESLLLALSKLHHCPFVSGETLAAADIEAVRLLPAEHAIRLAAIPYSAQKGTVRVAFLNPSNLLAIDEVSKITGRRVLPAATTEIRLLQAHQRFYGRHIPAHLRTILQKVERKTQGGQLAPGPLGDSAVSPPVEIREAAQIGDRDLVTSSSRITPIEIPELPLPAKRREAEPPAAERSVPEGGSILSMTQDAQIADMWRPAPPPPEQAQVLVSIETAAASEPALELPPSLCQARSREEIGDALLQNFLTDIPRVILLGVGKALFTGWRGRGPGLLPEQIGALRISTSEPSVFTLVAESGAPHFGVLGSERWPRTFRVLFGPKPPDCAIFPIRVLDGLAALLYADRLGKAMPYEDFALVARAAGVTANVLSRFLLRQTTTAPIR